MLSESENCAIVVTNLTKRYRIFDNPGQSFLYHVFKTDKGYDFTALDNVSFEVKKGESFGIIGRNGSGKSTLLQILAGILKESEGTVKVRGRVAALLELGSGFDPDSTGYENIYMNAAILGVKKDEIDKKVGEIVEFAEIGDFIDQPVKTYSSGMFVRLAFAVAINVDADVLLIDEALAVGDVFFRQKCYDRLNKLKEKGITIILVSHGMNEVEQFCDRTLLLDASRQVYLGDSKAAVNYYYLLNQNTNPNSMLNNEIIDSHVMDDSVFELSRNDEDKHSLDIVFPNGWILNDPVFLNISEENIISNGNAKIVSIGVFDQNGHPRSSFEQGEKACFYAEIELLDDIEIPLFGVEIINQKGIIVHGKDLSQIDINLPGNLKKGYKIAFMREVQLDIEIGEYTFNMGFCSIDQETYGKRMMLKQEEFDIHISRMVTAVNIGVIAIMERKTGAPMKQAFHGICDLPGSMYYKLTRT